MKFFLVRWLWGSKSWDAQIFLLFFAIFFNYAAFVGTEYLSSGQFFARVGVILCIGLIIILGKYRFSFSKVFIFFLVMSWSVFSYFLGTDKLIINYAYLAVFLFYIHARGESAEVLIYNALLATLLCVFIVLLLILIGAIALDVVTIGGRVRYYFGFVNPNKAGIFFYSAAIFVFWYLSLKKVWWLWSLLITVPFVYALYLADSRAALFSYFIFVFLFPFGFISRLNPLMVLAPMFGLGTSLWLSQQCGMSLLDSVLSGRPCKYSEFVSSSTFLDFFYGANFEGFLVDNSYILAFFTLGILFFFLVCTMINVKDKTPGVTAFIIAMFCYGLFEGVLVRVEFPVVIVFYALLFGLTDIKLDRNKVLV